MRRRLLISAVAIASAALIVPMAGRGCAKRSPPAAPGELLDAARQFPPPFPDLPQAVPLAPLLAADAPDRLAVLSPTETALNLRPSAPLVVRFNRPMVDGAHVGAPLAESPLRFSPAVKGRATWTSRSTLTFEADPKTWGPTRDVRMDLEPGLRSLAGEEVADPIEHTVVFDDGPRLVGSPDGARLVPGAPIRLAFSGKVLPAALGAQAMIYEVGGGQRMLPFTVSAPRPDAKGRTLVDLVLSRTLEPGANIAVALAPTLSQGGSHPRVIELELQPRPRIEGIDCPKGAEEASACRFTAPPGQIVDIAEALRLRSSVDLVAPSPRAIGVSPPLEGLRIRMEGAKTLVVSGDWAPGQVYQVNVSGLRDASGNPLSRTAPLAVRSAGQRPEVRVATGAITFERDAASRLPLAGIHVEDGEVRIASVPAGGEWDALFRPESLTEGDPKSGLVAISLSTLLPAARPNRWAKGSVSWPDPSRLTGSGSGSSMVVLSVRADKREHLEGARTTTFIQQTDLGIDAQVLPRGVLVWVTSIATAEPVAGASVTLADLKGQVLATLPVAATGLAWFPVAEASRIDEGVLVRAVHGADRAVITVDPRIAMGPRHLGRAPGEPAADAAATLATVFTDRGIVRPGETVHVKAILRTRKEGELTLPATVNGEPADARIAVFGPSAEAPIADVLVKLSSFGTAFADFTLPSTSMSGTYRVEVTAADSAARAGGTTFTVGEYRPPVFRVDLAPPSAPVVSGDTLSVGVAASHLFGPPAAGMAAHFTITREATGAVAGWEDYVFQAVDTSMRQGTMAAGDLKLDEAGRAVVQAPADLGARVRATAIVEVSVDDVSGLSTSMRQTIPMFPAAFEVGVRAAPAWVEPGGQLDVDAIVIDHGGKPARGRTVEARILREGFHRYWEWAGGRAAPDDDDEESTGASLQARRVHRSEVAHQCKLSSADEPVHCRFTPERPGTYVLEAVTRDDQDRISVASQRVYVAGPDEHPDRDAPGTRLELTPAVSELRVGEIAEIAFESPFPTAEARLVVQRDGVERTEVRRVSAGGNVFRFPATKEMIPNAFVSLSLVRPRTGPPGEKIDLDAPDLRVGLTEITVRPEAAPLTVTVEAAKVSQAGGEATIGVNVKDAAGEGAIAEVALYAVDEGTLRVTGYQTPDALQGLFPPMAPAFAWEDLRRGLASRISEPLLPGAGGDGGEPQAKLSPERLERFEPTPLWMPRIVTDASGHATTTIHLPERPTQYRIMAVATDAGVRAGRGEQTLVATMPLVVRPVLPAVAMVGDRFEAVAFVHNTEDAPIDAIVTPLVGGAPREPIHVHVEARRDARVASWIEVQEAGDLTVRFEAESERGTSRAEGIVRASPRARVTRSSAVGAVSGSRHIALEIPAGETQELTITLATNPFVGFATALDALCASKEDGVEATASSVIGLVSYTKLGMDQRDGSASPEEVEARTLSAIGRLAAMQASSGGFGDASADDPSDDYLTAYALHALSSASLAGLPVDEEVRKRAGDYLDARVRGSAFLDRGADGVGHDELAFALRVLAEAQRPDADRMTALFNQRDRLSPYGLAELALAMDRGDFRRVTLASDAQIRVLATREDERTAPGLLRWYDSSARSLGAVLEAVSTTDWMEEVTPYIASRLLQTRNGETAAWYSTHETSHALAALATYATVFATDEEIEARVMLDGTPIAPQETSPQRATFSLPPQALTSGEHDLRIECEGTAWLALAGSFMVPLGAAEDVARGAAAALHRVLEDASGKPLPSGSHVKLGDLVRVRLFLFSEEVPPPYLAVQDRLGGGLEPIDGGHETTPREALSALLGMGPDDDVIDARAHYAMRSLDVVTRRSFHAEGARFSLAHAPSGLQELTYGVRATTVGTFVLAPAEVRALYARGFTARSTAATLIVDP